MWLLAEMTSLCKKYPHSNWGSEKAIREHTYTHAHTLWPFPSVIEPRLTYSQLLTEDCPFTQRRTVPASISELVLTLIDAHLSAFAHNNDGVRAALADCPLARCQPGNLVADDVGTQSYHRGQGPAKVRETHAHMHSYTQTHTHQWTHRRTQTQTQLELPEDGQTDSLMWDSPEQDSIQPVMDVRSVGKWKLYSMIELLFNGLEVTQKPENLIQHKKKHTWQLAKTAQRAKRRCLFDYWKRHFTLAWMMGVWVMSWGFCVNC